LELSIPAVKSRLLRARVQLRERLSRFFQKRASGNGDDKSGENGDDKSGGNGDDKISGDGNQ